MNNYEHPINTCLRLLREYEKKIEKFREVRWIPFKEMDQKQRIMYRKYLNTLKNEERKLL